MAKLGHSGLDLPVDGVSKTARCLVERVKWSTASIAFLTRSLSIRPFLFKFSTRPMFVAPEDLHAILDICLVGELRMKLRNSLPRATVVAAITRTRRKMCLADRILKV